MALHVALHHRTQYRYDKAVALGPQVIQLRPAPHCRTPILSYALDLTPRDYILNWQYDALANRLARVIFPSKTTEFAVDVHLVADLTPYNPFDFFLEPGCETYPFQYPPDLAATLEPYRSIEPGGPLLRAFLKKLDVSKQGTVNFLVSLNQKVRDEIGYVTRLEHGVQTCEQTLEGATGSCRDSAWLLVQVCRHLGLAARFVSGYLIQLVPDEKPLEGPPGPTIDSADLHAWAEVFLPGAGWIGLDPTSGLFTSEGHIPLVCTPSAAQAAPIGGTVEYANVDFDFSMTVRRLEETPSLAQPYTNEQWANIRDFAHEIDRDIEAQDIRLTMGGEPTYVRYRRPRKPAVEL